jgi:hypothetical protein
MARRFRIRTVTGRPRMADLSRGKTRSGARTPLTSAFWEVQLAREHDALIRDQRLYEPGIRQREIIGRVKARRCELCERARRTVEVHKFRSLAALNSTATGPAMASRHAETARAHPRCLRRLPPTDPRKSLNRSTIASTAFMESWVHGSRARHFRGRPPRKRPRSGAHSRVTGPIVDILT